MQRLIITILFFLSTNNIFSQTINYIDFDFEIFNYKDSINKDLSFDKVIKEIKNYSQTDTQRICLIAGWIYENIDFDLYKLNTGGAVNDYETVFNLRKGTCGDYSSLFSEFCDRLGIENEIIEGYVPEYDSDNLIYTETNHAWNIVKLGNDWYHCDLLGFSGYLKQDSIGNLSFVKQPNTDNILTLDNYFIGKHIPADPMWQLTEYPIQLDSLLIHGAYAKHNINGEPYSYNDSIASFLDLATEIKKLKFADNAHRYNKNNHNVIVTTYFNAAINLLNKPKANNTDLLNARDYLLKAQSHIDYSTNGVQVLKTEIERAINYINKYVP